MWGSTVLQAIHTVIIWNFIILSLFVLIRTILVWSSSCWWSSSIVFEQIKGKTYHMCDGIVINLKSYIFRTHVSVEKHHCCLGWLCKIKNALLSMRLVLMFDVYMRHCHANYFTFIGNIIQFSTSALSSHISASHSQ